MEMALVEFPSPVAETSTSPDRERHADRAVIIAFFLAMLGSPNTPNQLAREFARRGNATGFSVNPLLFPRDVSSTGQVIRDIGNVLHAEALN